MTRTTTVACSANNGDTLTVHEYVDDDSDVRLVVKSAEGAYVSLYLTLDDVRRLRKALKRATA